MPYKIECSICKSYQDKDDKKVWYYPTAEERRISFSDGKKYSHTYCPSCMILTMEMSGFSKDEIKSVLDEVDASLHKEKSLEDKV